MKKAPSNNFFAFSCMIFSFSALFISFIYEYAGNHEPCSFCKYQRYALAVIFFGSIFWKLSDYKSVSISILKLGLLCSFFIATSHFLIQIGLISDFCYVPKNIKSIEEFDNLINNYSTSSSCSKISWKIFGVSAPAYNAFFSMMLFLLPYFHKAKNQRLVTKVENFS